MVHSCLYEFGSASCLIINLEKLKLFVSLNIDDITTMNLSFLCGIHDLGNYLQVIILHKRLIKEAYTDLMGRVMKKL